MFGFVISTFNAVKPFRGKQRLLKALFRWLPFSNARSYYGVKMVRNISDSTWRACMVGSYGDFISRYISRLSEPFVFLDIGANQGLFGLCASKNPNCRQVVAFEPNPDTFALLVRNIALSKQKNKFFPVCAAISTVDSGIMEMAVPINHSGASSSQTDNAENYHKFSSIVVNSDLLKKIVSRETNSEIHAKIDVEGAEIFVLEELAKTGLLDEINSIIIEISTNIEGQEHINNIMKFFKYYGWTLSSRSGGVDPNNANDLYDAVYTNPKITSNVMKN